MFTNTDGITYEIKSKDVYDEFFKYKHLFDFREHQSIFFDPENKKVIGKMKDEFKVIPIKKFIGLKSKMYCIVSDDDTEFNTAKGVNILIDFNKYKNILFDEKIIKHNMKRIPSKKNKIGTHDVNKLSLPHFDGKRYILNDGITRLAYFHKDSKD